MSKGPDLRLKQEPRASRGPETNRREIREARGADLARPEQPPFFHHAQEPGGDPPHAIGPGAVRLGNRGVAQEGAGAPQGDLRAPPQPRAEVPRAGAARPADEGEGGEAALDGRPPDEKFPRRAEAEIRSRDRGRGVHEFHDEARGEQGDDEEPRTPREESVRAGTPRSRSCCGARRRFPASITTSFATHFPRCGAQQLNVFEAISAAPFFQIAAPPPGLLLLAIAAGAGIAFAMKLAPVGIIAGERAVARGVGHGRCALFYLLRAGLKKSKPVATELANALVTARAIMRLGHAGGGGRLRLARAGQAAHPGGARPDVGGTPAAMGTARTKSRGSTKSRVAHQARKRRHRASFPKSTKFRSENLPGSRRTADARLGHYTTEADDAQGAIHRHLQHRGRGAGRRGKNEVGRGHRRLEKGNHAALQRHRRDEHRLRRDVPRMDAEICR